MQRYRAKLKQESRVQQPKKSEARKKVLGRKNETEISEKEKARIQKELASKKQAIRRTQNWRLKVKLRNLGSANEQTSLDGSAFSSESAKKRALRKAKGALPHTPAKKAAVLKKILTPRTSKVLSKQGVIVSPRTQQQNAVNEKVVSNLRKKLFEIKPKGTEQTQKNHAYNILKSVVNGAPPLTKRSKLRNKMKKYFSLRG